MQRNAFIASALVVIAAIGAFVMTRSTKPAPRLETASAPIIAPAKPAEPPRPVFAKPRPEAVAEAPAPRTRPLRRKPKAVDAAQAADARGLAPSAFADGRPSHPETTTAAYRPENAQVSPAKIARHEKNFSNPMDGRWVNSLSGGGARVDLGKKAIKTGNCSETRNCERKPAPEQAWIAGVVVTTERLEARPSDPLDLQMAKGHYLDETPGVYLK